MKYTYKWYWLRWRVSFYEMLCGFVGVVTFGFVNLGHGLVAMDDFISYTDNLDYLIEHNLPLE